MGNTLPKNRLLRILCIQVNRIFIPAHLRKQRYIMRWTVALALLFGALLTAVMWWLAKPKH